MPAQRLFRVVVPIVAVSAAALMWAAPAQAADPGPVRLLIDPADTQIHAIDAPVRLQSCVGIPGGAKRGVDGWVFDQPITVLDGPSYVIGYIDARSGTAVPVILEILPDRIGLVLFNGGQPDPTAPLQPVPDGVIGGMLDGGMGGAWLQTPAGWELVFGVDNAQSGTATASTFGLTAVCLPTAESQSPTPSPVAASPSPSPVSPSTVPTTGAGGGTGGGNAGLPVTGSPTAPLVAVGALLTGLGGALLLVRRRRSTADPDA
ncbi:MAG: hypothetical protein V7603_1561 [Micromonosporaceae bacterium]